MVSEKWTDRRFGKRLKGLREGRGWSQSELAEKLAKQGVHPMHSSTIAKIEVGTRSVRINEAAEIASLFETSVDFLLGRRHGSQEDELAYVLRMLRDTARRSLHQVWEDMETIREQIEELPAEFDDADLLQKLGYNAWSNYLFPTYEVLAALADLSDGLLRREQGRPGLTREALMELVLPPEKPESFEELKARLERLQEEPK